MQYTEPKFLLHDRVLFYRVSEKRDVIVKIIKIHSKSNTYSYDILCFDNYTLLYVPENRIKPLKGVNKTIYE